MIEKAEIISQPYSGQFEERIYDYESPWNSQSWTWIKFTNVDFTEWCGHFRGFPKQVAISFRYEIVLVLTSKYIFQLDINSGNLMKVEDHGQYHNLTVAPNGDFLISDYYHIEKVENNIDHKILLRSPIKMDLIEFKKWNGEILEFTCDEFLNWNRHLTMEYDCKNDMIKIKNAT
ncbi:hypothetical protein [Carboxylicivirga taeanensis]|uniref:hypothetical protein n=1 Tax=Carboxylicivirga taeanensis TaxID=1416875 RepID=UPI003F6DE383